MKNSHVSSSMKRAGVQRRRLFIEGLERRDLMAGDCHPHPYQTDVDFNGWVDVQDILWVIHDIRSHGGMHRFDPLETESIWPDVDFDGGVDVQDILYIIQDYKIHGGAHRFDVFCDEQPSVSVGFSLESSADTFGPNDLDVVLVNLAVGSSDGPAILRDLYVGIEGRDAASRPLRVQDAIEDVDLRDPISGRVYQGVVLTDRFAGLEVVRFSDVYVDESSAFQLRMDPFEVSDGDRFRAHVVTQTGTVPTGFGGLITPTAAYNLAAEDRDGNDVAVVPGGVLSGAFRAVDIPQLNVAARDIGLSDTAVKNERNIALSRFDAHADASEALLFTDVSFVAASGNLANVRNAALWFDSDNDGTVDMIAQSGVYATAGAFHFNAIVGGGIVVPAGATVTFEIHADVSSSLMPDPTLALKIDPSSVHAEEADSGLPLPAGQIVVNDAATPKSWRFVSQGDLFVTNDSTPTRSLQLLLGVLGGPIARWQLRAQNEAVDVYKVFVSLPGVVTSVDRLELFLEGATTPFATATVAGVGSDPVPSGYTTFAANMQSGQLVVPEGRDVDVIVRPRMKSDSVGGVPGEAIRAELVVGNGFQPVLARGRSSSNNLSANDGDAVASGEVLVGTDVAGLNRGIVANGNVTVGSRFVDARNANPDADNTNVPVGIAPFAQFKLTAAVNNNASNGLNRATLESFVVYVDASNVLVDAAGFKVYNKADASTKVSAQAFSLSGTPLTGQITGQFKVRVSGLSASAVDALFESGEASTIVLEANVLNSHVQNGWFSSFMGSLETEEDFVWIDADAAHSLTLFGANLTDTRIRSTQYRS